MINDTQHTPGPWRIAERYDGSANIIAPDGYPLAVVDEEGWSEDFPPLEPLKVVRPEWRANAHLIKASPNLLAALEVLLDIFERVTHGYPPGAELQFAARDKALAAIAEAKEGDASDNAEK